LSLDAAARRRYARQLLLGEIDEAGQERLLDARFRRGAASDPDAFVVAADYLGRAGCTPDAAGDEVPLPGTDAVRRFAGGDALVAPAAAVVGAFAAVEHLKAVLGVGTPQDFPSEIRLTTES
jgi:molybdopterin/thiamine biosynthesis adenylyltransferase